MAGGIVPLAANPMTFVEIKDKIDAADFSALIGLVEDEQFEAKSGKYDFSCEAGKQELAKDVASFANRSGGIIVIGPKTSDDPTFFGRRVSDVSLVPFDLINPSDYQNVIKAWVYPRPDKVDIMWVPSKDDPHKGLFYILIPNQPDNLRPFLITKDIDPATNRKRKEIMFGYVERHSHTSDPVDFRALHSMLRLGRENHWKQQLDTRLARIEAKLSPIPIEGERQKDLHNTILSRTTDALKASSLSNHRAYSLAISPLQTTEVQSFLNSEGKIIKLLEDPPMLRSNGWGVYTSDRARLMNAELRLSKADKHTVLGLYRDGTLVFACSADEAFLGFNYGKTRINPVAVIETTYLFFDLYHYLLKDLTPPPNVLCVWIQFFHMHQDGLITSLAPYGVNSHYQTLPQYRHQAPKDNYLHHLSIQTDSYDPSRVAFQALREIYGWFQIEENKIPYLTNDLTAVDPEKIRALGRHSN